MASREPPAARLREKLTPRMWTAVVIGIGFALGIITSFLPRPRTQLEPFETITSIDIVVSVLGMTLIVALLYIHAKTYTETRAPLALGLFVVLGAFLFQAILSSPVFYAAFGQSFLGRGLPSFALAADAFEAFAFAAFLYISAQ